MTHVEPHIAKRALWSPAVTVAPQRAHFQRCWPLRSLPCLVSFSWLQTGAITGVAFLAALAYNPFTGRTGRKPDLSLPRCLYQQAPGFFVSCPYCNYCNYELQGVDEKIFGHYRNDMGPQRGRPPKPKGTTLPETLQIRLTADDKARWSKAAKAAEQSLSEWIRDCLDKAAGKAQRGDSGERGNRTRRRVAVS